jgi:SAM-dependent methyltransferase
MHDTSYFSMQAMISMYLDDKKVTSILDVGSLDTRSNSGTYFVRTIGNGSMGGTYRGLFASPLWTYTGLDMQAGSNVDILAIEPYKWPIEDSSFDVVISGQCLEHVEEPWLWIKEVERVCRPGGLVILIVPWSCGEHRYPVDCWRILPDGMRVLLTKCAKMEILFCKIEGATDTVAVARKPQ